VAQHAPRSETHTRRQHTSAYVSIRQHTSASRRRRRVAHRALERIPTLRRQYRRRMLTYANVC
jgi:hypothetical protein